MTAVTNDCSGLSFRTFSRIGWSSRVVPRPAHVADPDDGTRNRAADTVLDDAEKRFSGLENQHNVAHRCFSAVPKPQHAGRGEALLVGEHIFELFSAFVRRKSEATIRVGAADHVVLPRAKCPADDCRRGYGPSLEIAQQCLRATLGASPLPTAPETRVPVPSPRRLNFLSKRHHQCGRRKDPELA